MDIISCSVNGKYAGTTMGKKNGWGNGYIFAYDEFPGVGAYLASAWLEMEDHSRPNSQKIERATIEDNNIKSIKLHRTFGYERTKQFHKILIRRK